VQRSPIAAILAGGDVPDREEATMTQVQTSGKAHALLFLGISLTLWSSIALFFLIVGWVAGGTAYKDSIYGNYAFIALAAALIVGVICGLTYRRVR